MAKCECLEGCPFFNGKMAMSMPSIAEGIKKRLCLEDNTNCARHMVFRTLGKPSVPADLLPNQVDRAQELIKTQKTHA